MLKVIVKNPAGKKVGEFTTKDSNNLLDLAEEFGIEIPYSCHAGACMTCVCEVAEGREHLDNVGGGEQFIDTDEDEILSCITTGITKKLIAEEIYPVTIIAKNL